MKHFRHALVVISFVLLAAAFLNAQDIDDPLPTVRGDEAVDELKRTGQYDSLLEALKATSEFPTTENLVGQSAKLFAADGSSFDEFGFSVSISGDTAVIGCHGDDIDGIDAKGSAYVFVKGAGGWTMQQKLTASDGAAADLFGWGVAIDGDTIIIGAAQDNIGLNNEQGSAYIFVRNGTTWTEQQKLIASDGDANDFFGENVSIDGETVIVGAYGGILADDEHTGAAYVFVRSGTTWSQQQKLTASDGAIGDGFGFSVSISGDSAIVGAWHDNIGQNNSQGSAYVFVRSGTTWTQQQKLTASDGSVIHTFGISSAIDGDTAIVGAFFATVGGVRTGAAYVFVRSGTVWTEQQKLFSSDGALGDEFGRSVAVSGDTVIVGAGDDNGGSQFGQGSAYIFTRSGTVWTEQQRLVPVDATPGAHFGISVAISGNRILVGAVRADVSLSNPFVPEANDQGAAYVFVPRVFVGGRILTADGRGVPNAFVQMTLQNGGTLMTRSSAFGYYRFDDVEADQTVTISVSSKQYQFAPVMVPVNGDLTNVDIVAQP